ncbi:MAG: hypothetical protein IKF90_17185 [Parasporobacterium sp.]|nr:hypothetical protein [Parasporobacterium sp.]
MNTAKVQDERDSTPAGEQCKKSKMNKTERRLMNTAKAQDEQDRAPAGEYGDDI